MLAVRRVYNRVRGWVNMWADMCVSATKHCVRVWACAGMRGCKYRGGPGRGSGSRTRSKPVTEIGVGRERVQGGREWMNRFDSAAQLAYQSVMASFFGIPVLMHLVRMQAFGFVQMDVCRLTILSSWVSPAAQLWSRR